jgi:DNA-binding transcriptional LysR family regulator
MENLRHAARRIGREPRVKFSVNTVEAARSLVSAGLGIALQPVSLLVLDERDRVTLVNVDGAWAERSTAWASSETRPYRPQPRRSWSGSGRRRRTISAKRRKAKTVQAD